MIGSSILIASAIASAAVPTPALRGFQNNYPAWAVQQRKSAAATLELIVEPDGKIRGCRVLAFAGDRGLAQAQCGMISLLRLTPATGPDGTPIVSRFTTFLSLQVEGSGQLMVVRRATRAPDTVLKVPALPDNFDDRKYLALDLLIDPVGKVKHCEGGKDFEEASHADLVQIACRQVADLTMTPLLDASGSATEHVANFLVRLEVG